MIISDDVRLLLDVIGKAGFEAFEVGGCVRDELMTRPCSDIDITTSAKPEEVEKILEDNNIRYFETGLKHGTVTAHLNGTNYEITTYRTDGEYNDSRHPETVTFVSDISEDLSRRDFTINAMAYNESRGLVDLFGGREDIENKLIRTVGNPDERFGEDALRIMRAIRFASVLGFTLEQDTKRAVLENRELLKSVSAERLYTELIKLLMGRNVFDILSEYREVIAVFIPEIRAIFDYPQHTKWHIYDAWLHTCKSVEQAPDDEVIRLIMLLHDIGKPYSHQVDENGVDHFKGHQAISWELASPVLKRLKVSNAVYERAEAVIPIHDAHIGTNRKNIKKWLARLGEQSFFDLTQVKRADKLAQNTELIGEELERLDFTEALAREIIEEGEAVTVRQLAIHGNDLIALGLEGRAIGELLDIMLEAVISDELPNTKESLLDFAKKYLQKNEKST